MLLVLVFQRLFVLFAVNVVRIVRFLVMSVGHYVVFCLSPGRESEKAIWELRDKR